MEDEIRRALAADAPRLTAIAHAAKRHWGYDEQLIALWQADLTLTGADVADGLVYCAERNGEVLGFHALSRDGTTFELEHLWIDPPHMGRGHGARLFAHALATARAAGGTELRIASDPNAAGFYRRCGARRLGDVPGTPPGRSLPLLVVAFD